MILQEQFKNFSIYTNRKLVIIMLLGFASGLPLLLTLSTLSVWLVEIGITKTTIGFFALVGLPYSLKFLWAPFMDNLQIPFLTKYEKAKILGLRAKQINNGSHIFVSLSNDIIDGYLIAELELQQKKIPFIIQRPMPNGGSEFWKVSDLEII